MIFIFINLVFTVTGVDEDFSDPPPSDEESMDEDSEWEPEAESVGSSKLKASSKK